MTEQLRYPDEAKQLRSLHETAYAKAKDKRASATSTRGKRAARIEAENLRFYRDTLPR